MGMAPVLGKEFLMDVMQFLILRGHSPLAPQAGLSEFPDAILNAKRLDLYNLYREVVSRGGFHVGSGINWKGQVFLKMRNHTMANRMTGVGSGCWNIQCPGFVQVSTDYPIGMVLEPISVYQGTQYEIKVSIFKGSKSA